MNFLLYIGGGYLWVCLFAMLKPDKTKDKWEAIGLILHLVSSVAVWIWLCWKFI